MPFVCVGFTFVLSGDKEAAVMRPPTVAATKGLMVNSRCRGG